MLALLEFRIRTNLEQILVGWHRHVLNLLDQLQEDWLLKVAKYPHILKHKPATQNIAMILSNKSNQSIPLFQHILLYSLCRFSCTMHLYVIISHLSC